MRPVLLLVLAVVPACASSGTGAPEGELSARLSSIEARLTALETKPLGASPAPVIWLPGPDPNAQPYRITIPTVFPPGASVPGPGDCVLPLPGAPKQIHIEELKVLPLPDGTAPGVRRWLRAGTSGSGPPVIRIETVPEPAPAKR